jgi:hypothetical protein
MLRRFVFLLALLLTLGLAVAVVRPAAAAGSVTYTDSVKAAEIGVTSNSGRFLGFGTGDLPGVFYTEVVHTPLGTTATITGGTLTLATRQNGQFAQLTASYTGGSVTQTGGSTGCSNQTFSVSASLGNAQLGSSTGGTGTFTGTLTHYRARLSGSCITFAATVTGTVSFSF